MSEQRSTPQNRTDGAEDEEGAPERSPQGRTDQDEAGVEEGRPGGDV